MFEEPARHIGSTRHFTGSEGEAFGQAAMGFWWIGKWLAAPIHPWGMRDASKTAHLQSCHFSKKKTQIFLGSINSYGQGGWPWLLPIKSSTGQTKIIELTHMLFCHPLRWLMLSTRNYGVNVPNVWFLKRLVFYYFWRLVSHKTCSKKICSAPLFLCRHVKSHRIHVTVKINQM